MCRSVAGMKYDSIQSGELITNQETEIQKKRANPTVTHALSPKRFGFLATKRLRATRANRLPAVNRNGGSIRKVSHLLQRVREDPLTGAKEFSHHTDGACVIKFPIPNVNSWPTVVMSTV